MGNRTVPFDKECKCDVCGQSGAYDFMGDYICSDCLDGNDKKGKLKVNWLNVFVWIIAIPIISFLFWYGIYKLIM